MRAMSHNKQLRQIKSQKHTHIRKLTSLKTTGKDNLLCDGFLCDEMQT